jgi:hypothetical protein
MNNGITCVDLHICYRCHLTQMTRPMINGTIPALSPDELTLYKVSKRHQICARSPTHNWEIGFDESSCKDRGSLFCPWRYGCSTAHNVCYTLNCTSIYIIGFSEVFKGEWSDPLTGEVIRVSVSTILLTDCSTHQEMYRLRLNYPPEIVSPPRTRSKSEG